MKALNDYILERYVKKTWSKTVVTDTQELYNYIINKYDLANIRVCLTKDCPETLDLSEVFFGNNNVYKRTFNGFQFKHIDISNFDVICESMFRNCTNLENIKIPDKVKKIENGAFKNCLRLKRVELGYSVKTIGKDAFFDCTELSEIVFNDKLKTIGEWAFSDSKVENIILPNSLKTIERFAFYNNTKLKEITIPTSVDTIGHDIFEECDEFETIKTPVGNGERLKYLMSGKIDLENIKIVEI